MDWPRFKKALASPHANNNRERLRLLTQESSFILDFLSLFYNALCRCQTADQCSALYPDAESTLTTASLHPLIAAHPAIARQLVACLLEYTKFEQSSRDQPLHAQPTSIQWCITRLRRLTHASTLDSLQPNRNHKRNNDQHIQQQLDRLLYELDDRIIAGTLHSEKLGQLLDMSLVLIHQDKARLIIEKLVSSAVDLLEKELIYIYWGTRSPPTLEIDYNDDDEEDIIQQIRTVKRPISRSFLDTLLQHHQLQRKEKSQLWYLYQQWPWHLKTSLWRFYDEILEAEIVDIIDTVALQSKYIPSDDIQLLLNDSSLFQAVLMNARHFRKVYTVISDHLLSTGDWRIFRLLWHIFDSVLHTTSEPVEDNHFKSGNSSQCLPSQLALAATVLGFHSQNDNCYDRLQLALSTYIYGGTVEGLKNRRCHAWLLPLMYPRFIYNCSLTVLEWCSNESEPWNSYVDSSWRTLGWMVCPSDDDRLESCLDRMREWILILNGFCDNDVQSVIRLFSSEWHDVFNGNTVVALIMTLSALSLLPHWRNDDYLSILDATLRYDISPSPSQQPTVNGNATSSNSSPPPPYNASIIYLFNDYLPIWESLLNPTMTFDDEYSLFSDYSLSNKLRHITTHVNSIIASL
ncbi:hypothetical protein BDB00DRAFT_811113 [Zychaea mexicana]|uniref:uncharacterized protein n=1 Tax=Zychaea mexicana TaxID=64656 RepID=UPI0022FF3224|nr:uncharacterized protein BDB00DRAFT_811113 [Zychaea mexicana]KAI9495956.1 hypothetical protein BDB00DRAFT_811113 [Zychaea mexicana]